MENHQDFLGLIIILLIAFILAGLLTPLTFTRHRLSPLAAFTTGAYFLHNGRRLTVTFLEACSQNVSGNKQQLVARAIGCPKNAFFPRTRDLLVSRKTTQRHFFPTLHPLSTVIGATATMVAFVLLRDSRFNFHCYTQREATPTQKSTWK